jgi:hypothetical protein
MGTVTTLGALRGLIFLLLGSTLLLIHLLALFLPALVFYHAALKYCIMGRPKPLQMYYTGSASVPLVTALAHVLSDR